MSTRGDLKRGFSLGFYTFFDPHQAGKSTVCRSAVMTVGFMDNPRFEEPFLHLTQAELSNYATLSVRASDSDHI